MTSRHNRTVSTPALDELVGDEPAQVLEALLNAHPHLRPEAETAARNLLAATHRNDVAEEVVTAINTLNLQDLAARSGRVPGGYVEGHEAAWRLLSETVEPFLTDLRRRADLGMPEAAAELAAGIVSGLYRSRQPADGTVAAHAGPEQSSSSHTRLFGRPPALVLRRQAKPRTTTGRAGPPGDDASRTTSGHFELGSTLVFCKHKICVNLVLSV